MSKAVIGKWLQKDVRQTHTEHFDRLGFDIEFEGLLYSEYKNLIKEHTVTLKGGVTKFEEDEFTNTLIARTIKKADGEEIDLMKKETLEEFGVDSIGAALDLMFNIGELKRVGDIAQELAGLKDSKAEKKEIEDLKN